MKKIIIFSFLIFSTFLFQSYSSDPPNSVGYAARNDIGGQHCVSCHGNGALVPTETGGLSLTSSGGSTYSHGSLYNLMLTIDTSNIRHGFQMVALDSNKVEIGHFISNSPNIEVQKFLMNNQGDSMEHISHKNLPLTNSNHFSFDWEAPIGYSGEVTFYAMAVASDGDGTANPFLFGGGDRAYYESWDIQYSPGTNVTNVPKENNNEFKIFPNRIPSNNSRFITLELNSNSKKPISMSIIDVQGRILQRFDNEIISQGDGVNVSALEIGVYWISLQYERGGVKSKQLIVY